jgi:hypothetical protein
MKKVAGGAVALSAIFAAVSVWNCVGDEPLSSSDAGQPSFEDSSVQPEAGSLSEASVGDSSGTAPLLEDVVEISAGQSHTCAVTASQDVLCWGSNGFGQLGVPITQASRSSYPIKVELGAKAMHVASGGNHSCAVMTDGQVKCWGSNDRGQLGRGTLVPSGTVGAVAPPQRNVALWGAVDILSAGATFTCAGVRAGDLNGLPRRRFFCWGENIYGQLASRGNGQPITVPNMITVNGEETTVPLEGFAIAAGDNFACAGFYSGAGAALFSAIGCWGSRVSGEIGVPPQAGGSIVNPQTQPDPVVGGLFKEGLVASGSGHACAMLSLPPENALRCWGDNSHGQVGAATSGYHPAGAVPGIDGSTISALAAGGQTTCLISSGQVQCIGSNLAGQLGRGSLNTATNDKFARVELPPVASALAVGKAHACAVLGAGQGGKGQVACWGQNQDGQLGDGIDVATGYPGAIPELQRVRPMPVKVLAPRR